MNEAEIQTSVNEQITELIEAGGELGTAVEFIRNSSIYRSNIYDWVRPLIDRLLSGQMEEKDIEKLVSDICAHEKADYPPKEHRDETRTEQQKTRIEKITSINQVSNVGQLDFSNPVALNDGLNVFYGKNAAGKSSLYNALCVLLGHKKEINPNLSTPQQNSSCSIKYLNNGGVEEELSWQTGEQNNLSDVMIFDNTISNYLVREDQENRFELAHLKIEYFALLQDLYDLLEQELRRRINHLDLQMNETKAVYGQKVPHIFAEGYELTKESIDKVVFNEVKQKYLDNSKEAIKALDASTSEAVIKNLTNAKQRAFEIISIIGKEKQRDFEDAESKNDDVQTGWDFRFCKQGLKNVRELVCQYQAVQKSFQESEKSKIGKYIPAEWISKKEWQSFINASLEFAKVMSATEKSEYTNKKCIYCHQLLRTTESRELIENYEELQEKLQKKVEQLGARVGGVIKNIDDIIHSSKNWRENLEAIKLECNDPRISGYTFDQDYFETFLVKIQSAVRNLEPIDFTDGELKHLEGFWHHLCNAHKWLSESIQKKRDDFKNRGRVSDELNRCIKDLEQSKGVVENKTKLIAFVETSKVRRKLESYLRHLPDFRRYCSTLKSKFYEVGSLLIFRNCLGDEYKRFGFIKHDCWEMQAFTSQDICRRAYRLGDKLLSEILSEGEQKIHALADFLAQYRLNNYRGVLIFDDPVSSLDEDNMEKLAECILQLVVDGNQVIVFTHNLVFLNQLLDTQKERTCVLKRYSNRIHIEPNVKLGDENKLVRTFKEIETRIQNMQVIPEVEISVFNLRGAYDLMSGYMEDYVEMRLFKNIINRYRPNIRMYNLERFDPIGKDVIKRIAKLYDQTSRKGARHSQPTGVKEPTFPELKSHFEECKLCCPAK